MIERDNRRSAERNLHMDQWKGIQHTLGRATTFMRGMIVATAMLAGVIAMATPTPAHAADTFVFATGSENHTLDPQKMSWMHDVRIAECLWEPLLRLKVPSLAIEPGVAERFSVSDDKLTYTFHLRSEARWSNGDPVTAHDFAHGWRRAMMPDTAADYTQLMFCIEGAEDFFNWRNDQLADYIRSEDKSPEAAAAAVREAEAHFERTVGVKAIDERTLVVKLIRPTSYFPELCAFVTFMPIHRKSAESYVTVSAATGRLIYDSKWLSPRNLVTNGPYVLVSKRFKRDMTMRANPRFWNASNVATPIIRMEIIEDPGTAMLSYRQGKVDWLPDVPTALPMAAELAAANRPDVHLVPAAGTYFYSFNCLPKLADGSPNPLADARVRRALSMAINREAIVKHVTRLNQPVAKTFTPVDAVAAYLPPAEAGVTFDPAGAKALLAEAGLTGADIRGVSILVNSGYGHEDIAQYIRKEWQKNLDIVVTLEAVESRVFGQRLKSQNYTIARASWFGDYRDPTTWLDKYRTDNGNNDAAWSDAEYDDLLNQAADEIDPDSRMALLRSAETRLLQAQPIAPIFQYQHMHVYDPKKVKGIHPNPWNRTRLEFVHVLK